MAAVWRRLESVSNLKSGDDFVAFLVDGDGVARIPLSVDDGVSPLPADDDGLLASCRAVQLLGLAFPRHGGVRVAGDHGRNWGEAQTNGSVTNRVICCNETGDWGCGIRNGGDITDV